MVQNRNKLIELFIGNITNSVTHKILEKAINDKDISNRYGKELINSLEIAKKYREKINPKNTSLPQKDIIYIKTKIKNKVKLELSKRILKGYTNINLDLIEETIDGFLKNVKIL